MSDPDPDLLGKSNNWLREELMRLREAIRYHRDQEEDDRCHEDDTMLYGLLPEKKGAKTTLPPKEVFLRSCERFWQQRQCPLQQRQEPSTHEEVKAIRKQELLEKLIDGSEFLGDFAAKYEFARLLVEHGLYYQSDSHLKHERRRRALLEKQDG